MVATNDLLSRLAKAEQRLSELTRAQDETKEAMDMGWIMTAGVLIFMMNAGFALLESGSVRFKNYQNVLLKNIMHALIGGLIWWVWGFAFAYGNVDGGFIGRRYFFGMHLAEDGQQANWWFQYAFAATAATIVSGSLAERINVYCYILFAFFMIGFIYPSIVAWTWGKGWLHALGYQDFAGSGIVHMTGGFAGLVGAIVAGPRVGRFTDIRTGEPIIKKHANAIKNFKTAATYSEVHRKFINKEIEIEHVHAFVRSYQLTLGERSFAPTSPNSVVLGTLILWVSWMLFNGGSSLGLSDRNSPGQPKWHLASRAMVNTVLAPSASGLFTFFTRQLITGQKTDIRMDFSALTNGLLAGCVSITASCGYVEPWAAVVIGLLGSVVYSLGCLLLDKLRIDDPLEAFQVHGCSGLWGVLAVAIFHKDKGLIYGSKDSLQFLGVQLAAVVCISGWSSILSFIYFSIFKRIGHIRLSEEQELLGGDIYYFAPIKMEGRVSNYAKGLQLTRLNSEMTGRTGRDIEQS